LDIPLSMAEIDVSFIAVSYNTRELTRHCQRSIEEQSEGFRYEIILIDDVSSNGSAEMVAADFANVRFVASNDNLGFADAGAKMIQSRSSESLPNQVDQNSHSRHPSWDR
jgi:GT2 family glycosyltransferase